MERQTNAKGARLMSQEVKLVECSRCGSACKMKYRSDVGLYYIRVCNFGEFEL